MSTALAAVVIVTGSTLLGVLGLRAVSRWGPRAQRANDNDVVGVFLSIVGALYGILLAFVVVTVWTDFADASKMTQAEAARSGDLLREAEAFPDESRREFRGLMLTYVREVVDEWDSLAEGSHSESAERAFGAVWTAYSRFEPRGERESAWYSQSIAALDELGQDRELRVIASRGTLPTVMWVLLIVGLVFTVAFTWLFQMERQATHAISVGAIAALTGFVLFLVFALQHPFSGDIRIQPDPFVEVLSDWRGRPL
jgi:heme/copper-type cytochrome/quinol oxidase subunit 2